jgi:hypothetical protein
MLPPLRAVVLITLFSCLFPFVASTTDTFNKIPKPTFSFDQLWKLEKNFWDSFLYPTNLEQTQGNSSTIFAPDVSSLCPLYHSSVADQTHGTGSRAGRYYAHLRRR